MSHTTAVKSTKIMSATALAAAVLELASKGIKCSLVPNESPRSYFSAYGREQEGMGKADFVMKLDDAKYDIGFYKQPDGSYEPRTDFWAGSVEKVLGTPASAKEFADQAKLGKLFNAYAVHATMEQARNSGRMVRRVDHADGRVQLVLTGY